MLPNLPFQEVRQTRLEYIKKRYNSCTCYSAPTEESRSILESYIEAMSCLQKLSHMFLLPEARRKYEYIAGVDTDFKMEFTELLEEISQARDNFSIEKTKAKIKSIYTDEFLEFTYHIFAESFKSKEILKSRYKKVLLD